jgi:crotonobetainyl-CoA:carnitine CoA-transferase CaiB-like acyl-CoA transferase
MAPDFGATVVRVDRVGGALNYDVTSRGKKSIAVDLKKPEGAKGSILRNCISDKSFSDKNFLHKNFLDKNFLDKNF